MTRCREGIVRYGEDKRAVTNRGSEFRRGMHCRKAEDFSLQLVRVTGSDPETRRNSYVSSLGPTLDTTGKSRGLRNSIQTRVLEIRTKLEEAVPSAFWKSSLHRTWATKCWDTPTSAIKGQGSSPPLRVITLEHGRSDSIRAHWVSSTHT